MQNKNLKRNFQCSAILLVFLVFAAGSVDQDNARPSRVMDAGNLIILDAFRGTTLQKETHKKQCEGKNYVFSGKIIDVTSSQNAEVMIDAENYANVEFVQDISELQKGETIHFSAKLDSFGTGILLNHQLSQGRLSR